MGKLENIPKSPKESWREKKEEEEQSFTVTKITISDGGKTMEEIQ